jgi:hypothetical protein
MSLVSLTIHRHDRLRGAQNMSSYSVGTYLLTLSHQQNTNSAIMSHSKPLQFLRFATVGYLVHNGVGTHQCASCMLQRLSHHPASHATTTLIAEARTHRQAASQDQHKHNADSTGPTVPIYRTACFIYCLTGTQLLLVVLSGAFQVVHLHGRQQ